MKKLFYLLALITLFFSCNRIEEHAQDRYAKKNCKDCIKIGKNSYVPKEFIAEYENLVDAKIDSTFFYKYEDSYRLVRYVHHKKDFYKIIIRVYNFIPYEQKLDTLIIVTKYNGEIFCTHDGIPNYNGIKKRFLKKFCLQE